MQHFDSLIGLVAVILWSAYIYGQHLYLTKLFALVSKLRRARKARGWSIEEAAWQIGVDTSTYHRWELGVQKPHGRNLHKLETTFQMKALNLFEEDWLEKAWKKYTEQETKPLYVGAIEPLMNGLICHYLADATHADAKELHKLLIQLFDRIGTYNLAFKDQQEADMTVQFFGQTYEIQVEAHS